MICYNFVIILSLCITSNLYTVEISTVWEIRCNLGYRMITGLILAFEKSYNHVNVEIKR